MNPSVAMDAEGDYAITWDGPGATADPLESADRRFGQRCRPQGVFVRTFHAGTPHSTTDEAVTPETRVNAVQAGYQGFSSVAMTPDGSYVVVWWNEPATAKASTARRYTATTDKAGPMLTNFLLPNGTPVRRFRPGHPAAPGHRADL